MNHNEFAENLLKVDAENRTILLKNNLKLCDSELAQIFRKICYEVWTNEPKKVSEIAVILKEIADLTKDAEIRAYTEWTQGIEYLVKGKLKNCLKLLDRSENSFKHLDKYHEAAATQTSKLYALAMLGRYEEAIVCGLQARAVFLQYKDIYSVGKIEHNIGNLYLRRDFYLESEPYLLSAHEHFAQLGDQSQMAMLENNLAFSKASQNQYLEAEIIYKQGLKRAQSNGLTVIQADIEASMSNLYLFQGRFNFALKFMESSRQKYDLLEMPHQSANCQLEIADIYLELNLLPEAHEFYRQSAEKFTEFGMEAELGKCFLNLAKTLFLMGENEISANYLEKAEKIFIAEGNNILLALVHFAKADVLYREKKFKAAENYAERAGQTFKNGKNLRQELLANWLLGEILALQNKTQKANQILTETLEKAGKNFSQITYLCLVSLGKLTKNEKYYLEAVEIIENSRAMLFAEEMRTAFASDKLLPYNELVKINLDRKNLIEALSWHERSRSRTLLETMEGSGIIKPKSEKLNTLKLELNWFYSRLNRKTKSGLEAKKELNKLRKTIVSKEKEYAEEQRRQQIGDGFEASETVKFDLKKVQNKLGETAIIEFISVDEKISAFVISADNFVFFEDLADENIVRQEIEQFIFQIKTARFQTKLSTENQQTAFNRMLRHSQKIYNLLIRPLEERLQTRQLTIIPSGFLYYLPFQSLHTGEKFLIESFELTYAPSLGVWQSFIRRKLSQPKKTVFVGVSDELTPLIKTEIETLGNLFEKPVKLVNENATLKNLLENLAETNILHLACHGKFRPDNPSFSALSLFNESLSVNDTQGLNLQNCLVVLSACETGLNKIVSGEELIGLTKGFLAAGASSLIVSLWTVQDQAALKLMQNFYQRILSANNPAKSLQLSQIKLLKENPHPYFWSPFAYIGQS